MRAAVSATGAVLSLLTALTFAAERGWAAPLTLAPLVVSAALLAVFVTGERARVASAPRSVISPTPAADGRHP
jgi:hypothetical protein